MRFPTWMESSVSGTPCAFADLLWAEPTVRSTGATFRALTGSPHSVPTILPMTERAAKEIRSANPNRGCTPLTGAEKSRAWLRHRIALQCSPGCLRAGFDSVQG
jgi:hypothetical protein